MNATVTTSQTVEIDGVWMTPAEAHTATVFRRAGYQVVGFSDELVVLRHDVRGPHARSEWCNVAEDGHIDHT